MYRFRQYGHYYGAERVSVAFQVVHYYRVALHRHAVVEVGLVELEEQRVALADAYTHVQERVIAYLHRRDYAPALF